MLQDRVPKLEAVAAAAADVNSWHENWGLFDIDDNEWVATREALASALAVLGGDRPHE